MCVDLSASDSDSGDINEADSSGDGSEDGLDDVGDADKEEEEEESEEEGTQILVELGKKRKRRGSKAPGRDEDAEETTHLPTPGKDGKKKRSKKAAGVFIKSRACMHTHMADF